MTPSRTAAATVFSLALVLRLAWIAADVPVPAQDTPDYDELAANVLAGDGLVSHDNWFGHPMRSWRAPVYPLMLAAIYGVVGVHHLAVQLVQALIGALTAVALMALGRRLHPPSATLVGLLAAVYPPFVTEAATLMTETLFTALLVGAVWAWVARDDTDWRSDAAAGVLLGLATLTRPVGILLLPALLLPAWWRRRPWHRRDEMRRLVTRSAWLLGGLLLVTAPWVARNASIHGAFVPLTTHGGFILARSNADAPDWRKPDGWGITERTFTETPGEVSRDRAWRAEALTWIAAHPGRWLVLTGERFLRFWYPFRPDYNVGFMLLLPVAAVGAWRVRREREYEEITLFLLISIAVFSALLYGSTRFRLPLEAFFLLYAAPVVQQLIPSRDRTWWPAGIWLAANGILWWQQDAARDVVLRLLQWGGLK